MKAGLPKAPSDQPATALDAAPAQPGLAAAAATSQASSSAAPVAAREVSGTEVPAPAVAAATDVSTPSAGPATEAGQSSESAAVCQSSSVPASKAVPEAAPAPEVKPGVANAADKFGAVAKAHLVASEPASQPVPAPALRPPWAKPVAAPAAVQSFSGSKSAVEAVPAHSTIFQAAEGAAAEQFPPVPASAAPVSVEPAQHVVVGPDAAAAPFRAAAGAVQLPAEQPSSPGPAPVLVASLTDGSSEAAAALDQASGFTPISPRPEFKTMAAKQSSASTRAAPVVPPLKLGGAAAAFKQEAATGSADAKPLHTKLDTQQSASAPAVHDSSSEVQLVHDEVRTAAKSMACIASPGPPTVGSIGYVSTQPDGTAEESKEVTALKVCGAKSWAQSNARFNCMPCLLFFLCLRLHCQTEEFPAAAHPEQQDTLPRQGSDKMTSVTAEPAQCQEKKRVPDAPVTAAPADLKV